MPILLFRLLAGSAAAFLLFALVLACDGLSDRTGPADVLLVLGTGGIDRDGAPTVRERSRLDRAVELNRRPGIQLVVVSGGAREAEAMAGYLAAHGVDRARLAVDGGGRTTYDSARNTALLLRARHLHGVLVVTQYFHVPRARLALERFGVEPVSSAHACLVEPRDALALAREAAAWIAYQFKDYRT